MRSGYMEIKTKKNKKKHVESKWVAAIHQVNHGFCCMFNLRGSWEVRELAMEASSSWEYDRTKSTMASIAVTLW